MNRITEETNDVIDLLLELRQTSRRKKETEYVLVSFIGYCTCAKVGYASFLSTNKQKEKKIYTLTLLIPFSVFVAAKSKHKTAFAVSPMLFLMLLFVFNVRRYPSAILK